MIFSLYLQSKVNRFAELFEIIGLAHEDLRQFRMTACHDMGVVAAAGQYHWNAGHDPA
jgi:hypothetical protein